MQVVSSQIIEKLKSNSKARYRLCYEFNVHMNTVNRWLDTNDVALHTPAAVNAIAEELEVEKAEILVELSKTP